MNEKEKDDYFWLSILAVVGPLAISYLIMDNHPYIALALFLYGLWGLHRWG